MLKKFMDWKDDTDAGELRERDMPGRERVDAIQGSSSFSECNLLDGVKHKQETPLIRLGLWKPSHREGD